MRKHCGMTWHQSNGYCKVRSLIHRVKFDYSVFNQISQLVWPRLQSLHIWQ